MSDLGHPFPRLLPPLGCFVMRAVALALALLAAACAPAPAPSPAPDNDAGAPPARAASQAYQVGNEWYHPLASASGYSEVGKASWYGRKFHGKKTASGETYDMHLPTGAHRTLPLPTIARVTNLDNGRSTQVRINDRGPFVDTHERIIDLSYAAAKRLGIDESGVAPVKVVALQGPEEAGPSADRGDSPTGEPVKESGKGPTLYLQVGAFREEGNAKRLKERLRGMDMARVVVTTDHLAGDPVYRVRLGPLSDVARADNLAQRLRRAGFPSGHLVRE